MKPGAKRTDCQECGAPRPGAPDSGLCPECWSLYLATMRRNVRREMAVCDRGGRRARAESNAAERAARDKVDTRGVLPMRAPRTAAEVAAEEAPPA